MKELFEAGDVAELKDAVVDLTFALRSARLYVVELEKFILGSEWSANNMDAMGPRCPHCMNQESIGHALRCRLAELCDRIRNRPRWGEG